MWQAGISPAASPLAKKTAPSQNIARSRIPPATQASWIRPLEMESKSVLQVFFRNRFLDFMPLK